MSFRESVCGFNVSGSEGGSHEITLQNRLQPEEDGVIELSAPALQVRVHVLRLRRILFEVRELVRVSLQYQIRLQVEILPCSRIFSPSPATLSRAFCDRPPCAFPEAHPDQTISLRLRRLRRAGLHRHKGARIVMSGS